MRPVSVCDRAKLERHRVSYVGLITTFSSNATTAPLLTSNENATSVGYAKKYAAACITSSISKLAAERPRPWYAAPIVSPVIANRKIYVIIS